MLIRSPRTPREGIFSQLSKPSLAVLFPHKRKALIDVKLNYILIESEELASLCSDISMATSE